jgi:Domain of unknown function (DUF4360)
MIVARKSLLMALALPAIVFGRLLENEEQPEFMQQERKQRQEQSSTAPFEFDEPTYYGSGCPAGTVEVIVPDFSGEPLTTMTVLFSDYTAQTSDALLRDRVSCNMALPIHVAPGLSVGIFKVDYRGYAYVPPSKSSSSKSSAQLYAEYFFAGAKGPAKSRVYGGNKYGFDDLFYETDSVGAIAWSPCGGTTNFRINTSLTASKPKPGATDVMIALDSKDIDQEGFYFAFQSRAC